MERGSDIGPHCEEKCNLHTELTRFIPSSTNQLALARMMTTNSVSFYAFVASRSNCCGASLEAVPSSVFSQNIFCALAALTSAEGEREVATNLKIASP